MKIIGCIEASIIYILSLLNEGAYLTKMTTCNKAPMRL